MKSKPNAPFVQKVEQFAEFLTPAARRVYSTILPEMSYALPPKEGGPPQMIQCQFLGVTVARRGPAPLLTPEAIGKLADLFNRAVECNLVGWGCLCEAVFIPLAPIKKRRGMLLVYTFSHLSKDELNAQLGCTNFVEEGEIPPE